MGWMGVDYKNPDTIAKKELDPFLKDREKVTGMNEIFNGKKYLFFFILLIK